MSGSGTVRERLLGAAAAEFAERGYTGASVRSICVRAGTNLGSVSYHFGGKRQLYRAVLRRSAEELDEDLAMLSLSAATPARERASKILALLDAHPLAVRLLLRDLAGGGEAALEALAPLLRRGLERHLSGTAGEEQGETEGRLSFAARIAPVLGAALLWPVLRPGLGLGPEDRLRVLERLLEP